MVGQPSVAFCGAFCGPVAFCGVLGAYVLNCKVLGKNYRALSFRPVRARGDTSNFACDFSPLGNVLPT